MRSWISLTLVPMLVVSAVVPVFAAKQPPPSAAIMPGLPVYPGSKVEIEVNLTQKDFLPLVRQVLSAVVSGGLTISRTPTGAEGDKGSRKPADPSTNEMQQALIQTTRELQKVFAGVTQFSFVNYRLPAGSTGEHVADFYMQKLGLSKGWMQTVRIDKGSVTLRLYTKPDLEGIFGMAIVPDKGVFALRTTGKIDMAALTQGLKFIPMLAEKLRPPMEQPAPPPAAEEKSPDQAPSAENTTNE